MTCNSSYATSTGLIWVMYVFWFQVVLLEMIPMLIRIVTLDATICQRCIVQHTNKSHQWTTQLYHTHTITHEYVHTQNLHHNIVQQIGHHDTYIIHIPPNPSYQNEYTLMAACIYIVKWGVNVVDRGSGPGWPHSVDRKTRNMDRRTGPHNIMYCFMYKQILRSMEPVLWSILRSDPRSTPWSIPNGFPFHSQ